MKRRSFLTTATLASAGLTTLLITGCTSSTKKDENSGSIEDLDVAFELDEETIGSLREKLASGKYTSEQLVQLYLDRIESIDKNGFQLNSVIEVNPDAIAIAVTMDKELKAGKSRGPLHGIPVLIKDNIDTADKMQTTAGSLAMVGNIASKDAFVVNIGVNFDIIIRPNFLGRDVLLQCTNALIDYFDIAKWNINQPINLSSIYTLLDKVKGVQTVQNIQIVNKTGGSYSQYAYDIEGATRTNIVYPSYDPMIFEVKFPTTDIKGKIVTL